VSITNRLARNMVATRWTDTIAMQAGEWLYFVISPNEDIDQDVVYLNVVISNRGDVWEFGYGDVYQLAEQQGENGWHLMFIDAPRNVNITDESIFPDDFVQEAVNDPDVGNWGRWRTMHWVPAVMQNPTWWTTQNGSWWQMRDGDGRIQLEHWHQRSHLAGNQVAIADGARREGALSAVVYWIAPVDGVYSVASMVQGGRHQNANPGWGDWYDLDGVTISVFHNDALIAERNFDDVSVQNRDDREMELFFNNTITFQAGDVLYFIISPNDNLTNDVVFLNITIDLL